MRGPNQLSTPLYSQLMLSIYAATNGLGGGAQADFVLGRGEPRYAFGGELALTEFLETCVWPVLPSGSLV